MPLGYEADFRDAHPLCAERRSKESTKTAEARKRAKKQAERKAPACVDCSSPLADGSSKLLRYCDTCRERREEERVKVREMERKSTGKSLKNRAKQVAIL